MNPIAFYRELRKAGLEETVAMDLAERFSDDFTAELRGIYEGVLAKLKPSVDPELERRRERDRERKREKRASAEIRGNPQTPPLDKEIPPTPPKEIKPPLTPVRPNRTNAPTKAPQKAFEQFWAAYPRKAGKGAARPKFDRAWAKIGGDDPLAVLLSALSHARSGWDDAQFIPHPATWLNQERWLDEPDTHPPPGALAVEAEPDPEWIKARLKLAEDVETQAAA